MARYLCPICDKELKGIHYCPECKRFIREPVIYHGENLPNVSSTRNYTDIGGRFQRESDMQQYNRNYGRPEGRLPYDKCHPEPKKAAPVNRRTVQTPPPRSVSQNRGGKKKGTNVAALILIIWFILVFFISFLGVIF